MTVRKSIQAAREQDRSRLAAAQAAPLSFDSGLAAVRALERLRLYDWFEGLLDARASKPSVDPPPHPTHRKG
jgi:hypothetical protein